jgi:lipopolysaccharide/colanic/teichoic acid biosynthesis glycosyltransferase
MLIKFDPHVPVTHWRPANWYEPCKVVVDFLLGAMLFVLALPVMLVVGLLVKLASPGPVLYRQTRLGKNGRPYTLYKIRSMRMDSEKNGACWSQPGDPRITTIGRFLRATHLDELPQIINVLRGEMSLVGPRPERPEFIPTLEQALPGYRGRLQVRPGVTGLAQVQLPADTDIESVRQKLLYDLHYVGHYGPWLDLRVILATTFKMFGVPFHVLGKLFSLPQVGEVRADMNRTEAPPLALHSGETGA